MDDCLPMKSQYDFWSTFPFLTKFHNPFTLVEVSCQKCMLQSCNVGSQKIQRIYHIVKVKESKITSLDQNQLQKLWYSQRIYYKGEGIVKKSFIEREGYKSCLTQSIMSKKCVKSLKIFCCNSVLCSFKEFVDFLKHCLWQKLIT